MRVRGDNQPSEFSVEKIPNRPGWCLARFYENAVPHMEDGEQRGWEYDEYHLELPDSGGLQTDIAGNFDVYLKAAKERDKQPPDLEKMEKTGEKNTSDIDYLSMMTGVDLPTEDEGVESDG